MTRPSNPTETPYKDVVARLHKLPRPVLWVLAARPKTLALSVTPVAFGTWLAAHIGGWHVDVLIIALLAAVAIQIGTNLWNDAADAQRGVDGPARLGPPRMTALGLLPAHEIRRGAIVIYAFAGLLGLYLTWIGGWSIVVIGLVSLALGYAYSMGSHPLSATASGEVLVVLFFGVVAVAGTVFLHGQGITRQVIAFGGITGLPAAAVLLLNNHRDRVADAQAGRRTLAIRLGIGRSRALFSLLLVGALVWAAALSINSACGIAAFAPATVVGGFAVRSMIKLPISTALNGLIARTALYQMLVLAGIVTARALCP